MVPLSSLEMMAASRGGHEIDQRRIAELPGRDALIGAGPRNPVVDDLPVTGLEHRSRTLA